MSVSPPYEFGKMEIPTRIPTSSCLSCQRAKELLTPPSSLPSSLPGSLPDATRYFEDPQPSCEGNGFCAAQIEHEELAKATKGFAMENFRGFDSDESRWLRENTYHYEDFKLRELCLTVAMKGLKVTVIVPAKEVASTIGGTDVILPKYVISCRSRSRDMVFPRAYHLIQLFSYLLPDLARLAVS